LLAEPAHAPRAAREAAVEALFEGQRPPALHLARSALLGALAVGKQSALVIDAGHRGTTGGWCWGREGVCRGSGLTAGAAD
jgi:actin-related protein